MFRLRTVRLLTKEEERLIPISEFKGFIVDDMIKSFLNKMKEVKCLEITEENGKTKIEIEGYVMSPTEFRKARQIISYLKSNANPSFKDDVIDLEKLLNYPTIEE